MKTVIIWLLNPSKLLTKCQYLDLEIKITWYAVIRVQVAAKKKTTVLAVNANDATTAEKNFPNSLSRKWHVTW